ncbi:MAG: 8-amino-7-oxononanoate synthase [Gammaproteobacteria bacterium]|nr:MAG: 8-amino-7-oxononanoate synthase [Gammaproteobacteria bacterium]
MHWLKHKLAQQRQHNRYRQRHSFDGPQQVHSVLNGQPVTSFCSNDYLGLANHPEIKTAFQQGIAQWGVGAGAAHLLNGHRRPHAELEAALAEWLGQPRALLFSTGYMANLAIATALVGKGDSIIQDRLNHASMIDGAQLSAARLLRYQHADADSLQRQLAQASGNVLVMTDGVFSMEGDIAPLPALAAHCRARDALLMVDDAHGLGVLGDKCGAGSVAQAGLSAEDVPLVMGTLGKALGGFGAFVAGHEDVIDALMQFARSYIYTTASPPALACANLAALRLAQRDTWRREKLQALIGQFKAGAAQLGLALMPSDTPIQPIRIGDDGRCAQLGQALLSAGFHVAAVRAPTVPAGTARLRITLSAAHNDEDIEQLLSALQYLL